MKKLKTLSAILISMAILLMMAVPVWAAGEYSISITNDKEGHTYEAYQIFTGDLTEGVLSNVQWGSGVNGGTLLTALKSAYAEKYGTCETAADVSLALGAEGASAADAEAFAAVAAQHLTSPAGTASTPVAGKYTISGLDAGYYLVKDRDNSLEGQDDSYTGYIVQVLDNVEMAPKSDVITSEKKVKDINDTTDTAYGNWVDTADHDIGDSIPFQLKATLPNNYADYESYVLTFHDTESAGLTFQESSVKVYIDGKLTSNGYTVVTQGLSDGYTFEVRFADLKTVTADDTTTKAKNDSVITVEYESVLNENAVIGKPGNPNKMLLTFSNNPNGGGTGKTPVDTVIVFTYKVVVDKVDQKQAPLAGAEFTLEKEIKGEPNTWETVEVLGTNGELTTFTFKGLDDGNYRLTETKTPTGYNTIDPITFTVTTTHEDGSLTLTNLSGNVQTGEITFTPVVDDGSLSATVINNRGTTLPETGGMGTTIFFVLGGILVLSAGVLLVVRIRMKAEDAGK
ncbi:MAG: isopeptide-forming domain-containing fimbrial protein [Massiliimalia sp.]|jgi:fimbrial isopeptide formation D2 family protein/LPXTG-motif cell wall-anchored protein